MRNEQTRKLDLDLIRNRLEGRRGQDFWRSLDEVAETPEFQDYLEHEFPEQADTWNEATSRRSFLKLMGASLALAGVTGCKTPQPEDEIIPYIDMPEQLLPGNPLFYATAMELQGYGFGLLAESNMGRPTKIEGNEAHPASLGATHPWAQAEILNLYDPDRSQSVRHHGRASTWDELLNAHAREMEIARARGGAGVRILTGPVSSPTLADQIQTLLQALPNARWHQWDPLHRDTVRAGARMAFGRDVETRYDISRAKVIVALDSDILYSEPGSIRYARDFADGRRISGDQTAMNRLYVAEPMPTITGSMADHRLRIRASDLETLTRALAGRLGAPVRHLADFELLMKMDGFERWFDGLVHDLERNRGRSVVIAGEGQPAEVHALAHVINSTLANVGTTVVYTDPVIAAPTDMTASLHALVDEMRAGAVDVLLIAGSNPAYDTPADLDFAGALEKVRLSTSLSLYEDETAVRCTWHVPQAHFLESWSDTRAWDGTTTIIQPLIAPIWGGRTLHEMVSMLTRLPGETSHNIVKGYWKRRWRGADFEAFWRQALHDGVVPEQLPPTPLQLTPRADWESAVPPRRGSSGVEIVFKLDPSVRDGRYANNGWLQELPRPMTKLVWDNAALISAATAARLGVGNEDLIRIDYRGRNLTMPVFIVAGHADESVTLHLGYGRTRAGRIAETMGFNAYHLRQSDAPWFDRGVKLTRVPGFYKLVTTQDHQSMHGRDLVRDATLAHFVANPFFAKKPEEDPKPDETLYPKHEYRSPTWGMAIDLNVCIGCNACTIACQAENNIPIVGKHEVWRGREMHWIRVDRYFRGGLEDPEIFHEPVPCMQCEDAPCELVCPVEATLHSEDGLNEMIYNRCIGTRYCSNNCPYKVRRFNFLHYSKSEEPSRSLAYNPEVTVRTRGVMEKCTYCVQRIERARIDAQKEMRRIRDGEIRTACQQVCPTRAIVFGDMLDPTTEVSQKKKEPRDYGLLTELNTRPRTTYAARIRNPNPEIDHG